MANDVSSIKEEIQVPLPPSRPLPRVQNERLSSEDQLTLCLIERRIKALLQLWFFFFLHKMVPAISIKMCRHLTPYQRTQNDRLALSIGVQCFISASNKTGKEESETGNKLPSTPHLYVLEERRLSDPSVLSDTDADFGGFNYPCGSRRLQWPHSFLALADKKLSFNLK